MPDTSLTHIEMVHLQIALEQAIKECDKLIQSCHNIKTDHSIWKEKKQHITEALSKLQYKYNRDEL